MLWSFSFYWCMLRSLVTPCYEASFYSDSRAMSSWLQAHKGIIDWDRIHKDSCVIFLENDWAGPQMMVIARWQLTMSWWWQWFIVITPLHNQSQSRSQFHDCDHNPALSPSQKDQWVRIFVCYFLPNRGSWSQPGSPSAPPPTYNPPGPGSHERSHS